MTAPGKIFFFGFGYTALFLTRLLQPAGWQIAGTTTTPEKKNFLESRGIDAFLFGQDHVIQDFRAVLGDVTHVVMSIPPGDKGDPVFIAHSRELARLPKIKWAGYLSTTAVYGNHDGNWVDEATPITPASRRGSSRARAEQQWQMLQTEENFSLHVFRLSGIYGPARSALETVRTGHARRIDKPGHVFNRIHVEDIAETLAASIAKPQPGAVYNLADDRPAASHDVITYACDLLGIEPPPLQAFDQVDLAPMVRSFYKDNKRIRNDRIKRDLGIELKYPDYETGLNACLTPDTDAEAFLSFETSAIIGD